MNKLNNLLLLILVLPLLSGSCHDEEYLYKLRVNNMTDKSIYVEWTTCYPDTSLITVANPAYNRNITRVEAKTLQDSYYKDASKSIFDITNMERLSVFVFDAATIESTQWETVQKDYLILQRYDLTLEDLEKRNWIINYPPTEDMKDIKMYPPYKK